MIKTKATCIAISILTIILTIEIFAQDPSFTQPLSTSMYTNPALTGFTGYSRIQLSQRIQWPKTPSSFYTTYVGADFSSKNNKLDFGIYGLYDNAANGILKTYSQNFTLAYQIPLTEKVGFRVGLNLGLISRSIELGALTFGDQIDSRYGFIYETQQALPASSRILIPNIGAGIAFHAERFIVGYSLDHINEPNQSLYLGTESKLPARHIGHGAISIYQEENSKYTLSLTGLYIRQQGFQQLVAGFSGSFMRLNTTLMYRNGDALIFCLGYVGKRIQARYSYDLTVSRLTNKTGGAHEISLGFLLGQRKENRISNEWIKKLF
jgi:type IX secretion system PorP/SprF family membrane protein